MISPKNWPEDAPLSFEKARALVNGPLGKVYKEVALACTVPIFWFRPSNKPGRILHNGTLTVVRTPSRVFGITAAHVLEQYEKDAKEGEVRLQLGEYHLDSIEMIDSSELRDLSTCEVGEEIISALKIEPATWPPEPPMESRGVLLAGWPACSRKMAGNQVEWTPFTALTTARTVTPTQITVLISREEWVQNTLPIKANLGGISGGPIISILETEGRIAYHRLSGIITEHPNYVDSDFSIERIVGSVADVVTPNGKIR